jgi:hypothetical protein
MKQIIIFSIIFFFTLILINKKVKETFNLNNAKIKNTDYIFIHIPKNAGTSFCKKYCVGQVGHAIAKIYNIDQLKKSIAIIRNPYDRIISCYNYFKMNNNYWKQKYGLPQHHVFCKNNSIKKFIDFLYSKKLTFDIHLQKQVYFLQKDGIIYTKLLKLENINDDFKRIFNKNIDLPKINKSKKFEKSLDNEDKEKVYKMYKDDFKLLGYNK